MKEYRHAYDITQGLYNTTEIARNIPKLIETSNVFPDSGVLKAHELDTIKTITGTGTTSGFPYPQIFNLRGLTLACFATAIYEIVAGVPTLVASGLSVGTAWSVADFHQFLVLSNGKTTIVKAAESKSYTVPANSSIPICTCCVNINGQLLIGGPDSHII